jgi:hypothetical protein
MNRWICYTLGVCALCLAQVALVAEAGPRGKPRPAPAPKPGPTPGPKPTPGPGQGHNAAVRMTRKVTGNTESAFVTRSPHKSPAKVTKADHKSIRALVKNPAVTKAEANALDKALGGEALSPQERSTLSSLALNDRPGVTQAEREAVGRALDDDLERAKVSLSRRYLYLHNDTGQSLTVSLVYQTLDREKKKWQWLPGRPPTDRVVELALAPGVTQQARHGKEPILAFRARVWASGAGSAGWDEWKDRDLLLVPEKDDEGNHRYYASTYDTFTFRFFKK